MLLFQEGGKKVKMISTKDGVQRHMSPDIRKRNDYVEFENKERGVVQVQKLTKRRDSVRR